MNHATDVLSLNLDQNHINLGLEIPTNEATNETIKTVAYAIENLIFLLSHDNVQYNLNPIKPSHSQILNSVAQYMGYKSIAGFYARPTDIEPPRVKIKHGRKSDISFTLLNNDFVSQIMWKLLNLKLIKSTVNPIDNSKFQTWNLDKQIETLSKLKFHKEFSSIFCIFWESVNSHLYHDFFMHEDAYQHHIETSKGHQDEDVFDEPVFPTYLSDLIRSAIITNLYLEQKSCTNTNKHLPIFRGGKEFTPAIKEVLKDMVDNDPTIFELNTYNEPRINEATKHFLRSTLYFKNLETDFESKYGFSTTFLDFAAFTTRINTSTGNALENKSLQESEFGKIINTLKKLGKKLPTETIFDLVLTDLKYPVLNLRALPHTDSFYSKLKQDISKNLVQAGIEIKAELFSINYFGALVYNSSETASLNHFKPYPGTTTLNKSEKYATTITAHDVSLSISLISIMNSFTYYSWSLSENSDSHNSYSEHSSVIKSILLTFSKTIVADNDKSLSSALLEMLHSPYLRLDLHPAVRS